MKRTLVAIAAALLLSSCQAEQTTCDRDRGDACLSAPTAPHPAAT